GGCQRQYGLPCTVRVGFLGLPASQRANDPVSYCKYDWEPLFRYQPDHSGYSIRADQPRNPQLCVPATMRCPSVKTKLFVAFLGMCIIASVGFGQSSYDMSQGMQTGEQVTGSYFATDIDSISMTNGNLHMNIPLFSL